MSGPYFGKVVAVNGKLVIGRGSECDLVLDEPEMSRTHAQIELSANEMYLRDLGSANGTFVNGVQVRDASLFTGDQIAFDRNRFLIEAPGMPMRKAESAANAESVRGQPQVTQTMRAIRIEDTPSDSGPAPVEPEPQPAAPWNPWWLIAAGALIAVGITLLFLGLR